MGRLGRPDGRGVAGRAHAHQAQLWMLTRIGAIGATLRLPLPAAGTECSGMRCAGAAAVWRQAGGLGGEQPADTGGRGQTVRLLASIGCEINASLLQRTASYKQI